LKVIHLPFRANFESVVEFERALAGRMLRGHRAGLDEGRMSGFTAGTQSAQLRCTAAQNIEIQGLRDRLVNYRALVRGQERQINQLQRLLGQAEDALRNRLQQEVSNLVPLLVATSNVPANSPASTSSTETETFGSPTNPN
jgi:hypothetical protein